MTDARLYFLLLTSVMLAILIGIGIRVYRKKYRQHYEEPKYRMLNDD